MHFRHGLSQPKPETPESLRAFLEKNQYPSDNQYIFSDSGFYFQAIRNPSFRKRLLSQLIFDRKGNLLVRDTNQCQWSGFELVKSLHPDSLYQTCQDLQPGEILRHIKPFGPDSLSAGNPDRPDFTVIVTWARFIGTYNARLFALSEAITRNKNARIRIIWLNIDLQKSWNLSKGQIMEIR
jgi:hypothetical protein